MNKVIILSTVVLGILISISKVEASVNQTNVLKGLQTAQKSPWDPREEEDSSNEEKSATPEEVELR